MRPTEAADPSSPDALWRWVFDQLHQSHRVGLLTVVAGGGGTPGKPGFSMGVSQGDELFGTIGGGIMEFNLVEQVRRGFAKPPQPPVLLTRVHRKNAPTKTQSGMICAGFQKMVVWELGPPHFADVEQLVHHFEEEKGACLSLTPDGYQFHFDRVGRLDFREAGSNWRFEQSLGCPDTVYIVGGGHVGFALSQVLSCLDVRVVLFDDRPQLDTVRLNTYAHQKIIGPFHRIGPKIPSGSRSFVVIVTTAVHSDAMALEQVILKDLKYLGLMGSPAKIAHIFDTLKDRGIASELLQKVSAPIGVPIQNQTPAEIAVSIAAELINVRHGGLDLVPKQN